ncbi:hypothetical protein PENSPDRAFT_333800 [Peniophora sp. CONT]|nr:hypothetical protein PENSPDRAFT_333800 [Peniophora sp. CONT]
MTESETPATMGSATPATKDFVGPTTSTSRVRKPHLSSFTGNVHAEAGLMALSYTEPGIIMHPGQQSLPIGVGKKCCWTCRKLSLLVQSGDTPHKFDLPGCHGTIHAWSPPEFGIPMAVLKSLCDALYDKAVEAAIGNAEDRKSQVSSPASEPGMLPELVIAEEYLPIP